jgi:microcystin-dependent protein
MGLEVAEFVGQLVSNWPLGTDRVREGDDHLRLLKRVLQNTFPNMNQAVTATPAQLNALPNDTSETLAAMSAHLVPRGVIQMWSGTNSTIPSGWALCNGQDVAGYGVVPDLRNKFILGSGDVATGSTGGYNTATTSGDGDHTHTINETVLTIDQIPSHQHEVGYRSSDASTSSGDQMDFVRAFNAGDGNVTSSSAGNGEGHTHTELASGPHTHTVSLTPPYYALAFIIKVTEYAGPV